jgi:hypothetical protein
VPWPPPVSDDLILAWSTAVESRAAPSIWRNVNCLLIDR